MLAGQRKVICFKSGQMSLHCLIAVPQAEVAAGSSLPCPVPAASREAGLPRCLPAGSVPQEPQLCLRLSLGAALRGAGEGLFPSAAFLHFPAHFLCFASCFTLFHFLSPALFSVGVFCLLLIFFLFLHMSLSSVSRTASRAPRAVFSPWWQGKVVSRHVHLRWQLELRAVEVDASP